MTKKIYSKYRVNQFIKIWLEYIGFKTGTNDIYF